MYSFSPPFLIVAYLEHKFHLLKIEKKKRSKFNIILLIRWLHLKDQVQYHHLRHRFIQQQNLTHDFDFSAYLEKTFESTCIQLVEIHWSVWAVVLMVLFANWVKYKILLALKVEMGGTSKLHELLYWLLLGWSFVVVCIIVWFKCRRIYHKVVQVQANEDQLSAKLLQGKVEPLRKLFWFNKPNFTFRLIQTILLLQAYYLSVLAVYLADLHWSPAWKAFIVLPSILTLVFYGPAVLPTYSLVANVEDNAKVDLIRKCQMHSQKQEKEIEKEETLFRF